MQDANDHDRSGDPEQHQRIAEQMRRLGALLLTRPLDDDQGGEIEATLTALADRLEPLASQAKFERFGLENRVAVFLETGEWPDPPPDGGELPFDPASIVGGAMNPFGIGARYFRDGDEAVGRVNVSRCFEGPPDRVHGGVICAIFDEVMGSVFRAIGSPSGFTGELAVRFEAPAPIEADLEFRARIVRSDGRKQYLEAEGTSAEGRFATATAVFIEMRREHMRTSVL